MLQSMGWQRVGYDPTAEQQQQMSRTGLNPYELLSPRKRSLYLQVKEKKGADQRQHRSAIVIHSLYLPLIETYIQLMKRTFKYVLY